jgi:hypothetical protein
LSEKFCLLRLGDIGHLHIVSHVNYTIILIWRKIIIIIIIKHKISLYLQCTRMSYLPYVSVLHSYIFYCATPAIRSYSWYVELWIFVNHQRNTLYFCIEFSMLQYISTPSGHLQVFNHCVHNIINPQRMYVSYTIHSNIWSNRYNIIKVNKIIKLIKVIRN